MHFTKMGAPILENDLHVRFKKMKNTLSIRTGNKKDAKALHALHIASITTLCAKDYQPEIIQRWIQKRTPEDYHPHLDSGAIFLGEHNSRIVGFGVSVPGEILGLFVHPECIGHGFGSILLDHALKLARGNEVDSIKVFSTLNARPFYEKHGFRFIKETTVIRNDTDIPVIEMSLGK